jgi:hypothetical protein
MMSNLQKKNSGWPAKIALGLILLTLLFLVLNPGLWWDWMVKRYSGEPTQPQQSEEIRPATVQSPEELGLPQPKVLELPTVNCADPDITKYVKAEQALWNELIKVNETVSTTSNPMPEQLKSWSSELSSLLSRHESLSPPPTFIYAHDRERLMLSCYALSLDAIQQNDFQKANKIMDYTERYQKELDEELKRINIICGR